MKIDNNKCVISSFSSVGEIFFTMNKSQLLSVFGREPDTEYKDYLKRTDLRWDNISVKLDKRGRVNEVSFVEGKYKPYFNNMYLFDDGAASELNKIEKPHNTVGFKVYITLGISLCGFGRKKDDKAVSCFSKSLIKEWLK